MKKSVSKLCSMLLVICMVVNMIPTSAFAVDSEEAVKVPEVTEPVKDEAQQPVEEIEEIVAERTEYTKTFRLDNGLYLAAVYPESVHYEEDGEWKEIDNTLRSSDLKSKSGYTNTAGVWDVYFPQELEKGAPISITKDGYQLSFGLAGELNQELTLSESKEVKSFSLPGDKVTYQIKDAKKTMAQIQEIDWVERKEAVEHEETVLEKLSSGISYEEIYDNTDITYGLTSNRVKESIVMKEYRATLKGYNYTLETGSMIPILKEDGQIDFYNETKTDVIMSMPAPFLVDSQEEYNYDIKIELVGKNGVYTLSYFLPLEWLADKERAWPVILDPIVNADLNTNNILDRTIAQTYTHSETLGSMECGYRSGRGLERIFLQYANIPTLKGSEIVVNAQIQLYKPQTSTGSPVVEVHKVNGGWHSSSITWANQPAHDPLVEDYCVVSGAGHFYWDVTDIVRGWYTNGNTGMMFKVPASVEAVASTSWEQFWSSDYSEYHDQKPTLYISYRHNNGIEPYYSYQSMSAGHAGTAYIADSTGQLKVVKNIAEYSSTVNPFSMNLVYNSDYFAVNQSATDTIQSTHGIDMYFGNGFTLDIVETIESANISNAYGTYLVHHDGDGTDHYFAKQADGTYKDEDGLGLTITGNSSAYIMKDDQGNTKKFANGILTELCDETGNKIWIHYEQSAVGYWFYDIYQKNVGGSDIKVATVTYIPGTSYIQTLTDAAGRTYTFTYLDNRLKTISLDGTVIAEYAYAGNRIVGMKDMESDYQLWFTYENGKVATIQEWIGYEEGAIVGVTYRNESTMYVDYGADRTRGTGDDTATYYAFDYAGRTVNACTTNSKGQVVGATNAVYSGTGATANVRQNNRTLSSATVGKAGHNMLANGSFESGLNGWTITGVENVASSSITRDEYPGMQHSGNWALMGYMPLNSSGTIGAYTQKTLKAGTTYTFSGYLQTYYINSSDWRLYLKVEAPDGTTWYSGDVNQYMGTTWMRQSVTFTAPTNGTYKLHVCCEDGYEWFYADDFQLEVGEAPTGYNLIYNGNLDDWQQGWQRMEGAAYAGSGANSYLRLVGAPGANCCAWQDITVDLPGTETYVLSGWAWADSVPDNVDTVSEENYAQDETKRFGLQAILIYNDGTKEYHYVPFCPDVSYWQYASLTIVPKQPTKIVSRIQPVCAYEKNANVAWFDDISLVREDAQTMRYDSEGKLVSVATTNLKEQTSAYQNGNLIQTYTGGNGTYNYTYDSTYKHRLTSVNNGIVKQSLGYDSFGNVTSTTLQHMTLESNMRTSATYSSDGNRLTSVTDTAGNTVSYEYSGNLSTTLGLATLVTDAKGIKNYYTYDGFGRLSKNSLENLTQIEYDYSKGQVAKITRSGTGVSDQTYEFTYDIWGNRTGVSVGGRQLATYSYGAKNGNLTAMNYGNGKGITYTYDEFGRVKTSTYSDGRVLTYTYTGEGVLYSVHDSLAEKTWYYNYDSMNRLHDIQTEDIYAVYQYDEYNRLSSRWFKHKVLGQGTEIYTYNTNSSDSVSDGLLTQMQMTSMRKISYEYDRYQRMFRRHIYSEREGGGFWESYSFKDDGINGASSLVSDKRNWIDNNTQIHEFKYTYDENGNILTETETFNNTSASYTYDTQNQLLSAVYGDGREEAYTYDAVGNILTFNNGVHSHTYTYGDTDWKDLLTKVDGQTITYDAIGNPLSYYNGKSYTMTWMEGRKLQTVTVDNQTTTYEYDYNGNRTKKINADGSYIKYYIVDGRTVGEIQYDATDTITLYIRYVFDEADSVIGFSLWYAGDTNWTTCYFVKNLQGDIIQIYRGIDNALMAEYSYDSWGNVISATGELAQMNPFRYRGYYYDVETGFYYLQSRYYDAGIGRFLNADMLITGIGGNIQGNNLFSYCFNNPINMDDSSGNFPKWIKKTVKWTAKNVIKPVVKKIQKKLSKVDLTYSAGINISGTPSGWIFNGQIGISVDTKGNIAIQASGGGGVTGGTPSISITGYGSMTNAPNINKLEGTSYQIGGTVGNGMATGGDFVMMQDADSNSAYFGLTTNIGYGTPGGEFHVEWGETTTLTSTQFNLFNVAQNIYIKIMEW